ncbi:MAG: hypothetical protein QX195_08025 [Methylococcaceae bacterium]|jgi:hypothetical protein
MNLKSLTPHTLSYPTLHQNSRYGVLLSIVMLTVVLLGCDNTTKPKLIHQTRSKTYLQTTHLYGTIVQDKGIITSSGRVLAADNQAQAISETRLVDTNHYRLEIPANTALPLVLTYLPNDEDTTSQKLLTVAVEPDITQYDLNPLSTAIAKKAAQLGGYSRANMISAAESTIAAPDANKTSTGFRGDPTTQYGGWH